MFDRVTLTKKVTYSELSAMIGEELHLRFNTYILTQLYGYRNSMCTETGTLKPADIEVTLRGWDIDSYKRFLKRGFMEI